MHIPRALAELASEALRYRNKLSDLAMLDKPARWERETPLKEAAAYARKLIAEYHVTDREAQKGREGPTVYLEADTALLARRLAEFKRGGEGLENFAAALPHFVGQVPEQLMGQAVDTIALAVLPADSFDPCRDPAACSKPEPMPPPVPPAKPELLRRVASWAPSHDLILRLNPNSSEPNAGRLSHGQIVFATGRKQTEGVPQGHRNQWIQITWIEVRTSDRTRWALESIFEKPDDNSRSEHVFDNHRTNFRGLLPASRPGPRYCAHAARLQGHPLPLRASPHESAAPIAHISPTSCMLTGIGDISTPGQWLQIQHDHGPTGWVPAHFLRRAP